MIEDTRPLVVCDSTGVPVDVALENEKGYKKSLETGDLWALYAKTGRLLPYDGGENASVEDRGTWYRAVLGASGSSAAPSETGGGASATGSGNDSSRPVTDPAPAPAAGDGNLAQVLSSLVAVIRDRRREMPEGSYTTHLFASGSTRIRKKAGEEAVELILAADRGELASEAADFLYHLLVLLEVEGVTLEEIAAELAKR